MARLLLVHAHPDDECIWTGATIAHHVARGDEVHVLTMTLGEEGDVIPRELSHLVSEQQDLLGAHRAGELAAALGSLGAPHSQVLGARPANGIVSAYRDSGMAGTASSRRANALVNADIGVVGSQVRAVLEQLQPNLVITHDATGGYGHPDHIATHQATRAALAALTCPPPLLVILIPRTWELQRRRWLSEQATGPQAPPPESAAASWQIPAQDDPLDSCVVDDSRITHTVDDPSVVPAQCAALTHHATQVQVEQPRVALSNNIARLLDGREAYARCDPATGQLVERPPGTAPLAVASLLEP